MQPTVSDDKERRPETGGNGSARAERPRAQPDATRAPAKGALDPLLYVPRLIARLFFPKLLDRYVLGEMIPPLLFGWTLFICLFVFSVNLFKLATMLAR